MRINELSIWAKKRDQHGPSPDSGGICHAAIVEKP